MLEYFIVMLRTSALEKNKDEYWSAREMLIISKPLILYTERKNKVVINKFVPTANVWYQKVVHKC